MIIVSLRRAPILTADAFAAAARTRFGERAELVDDVAVPRVAVTVRVSDPGRPGFTIDLPDDCLSVHVDGTPEQDAEVAAWVRSLLPADFPRLIGSDQGWGWHVELVHGVTPERVLSERVSHEDPHWADGDPDLA